MSKDKCHQFSIEHARLYGLREAVLIHNLHFWIDHNYANGKHFHDGRTWTYNSVHAFEALFPYLTYKQIRTSLDTLITLDVLVRGYYSTNPSDRSSWFAFTDAFLIDNPLSERPAPAKKKEKPPAPQGTPSAPQGKSTTTPLSGANTPPEPITTPFAQQGTPSAQEGESLIEQMVNTDGKQEREKPAQAQAPTLDIPADLLSDFMEVRKAKKSGPLTGTAIKGLIREADKAGLTAEAAVTFCVETGWQTFNAGWYAERTAGKPAPGKAPPRRTPAPDNFNASAYGEGGKL
ncbi:MAG: hypothetical protein ABJA84_00225 [Polaromonas sp.]